jgi:glyoxylase-like metal-dependent hydrolase (beta-lactamase superfamily II)
MTEFVQSLGDGIHVVDTGLRRPRSESAYLLVERGRAAFIDTGTFHAVPRLLGALAGAGLGVDAVDWVIPTHVHLDHAGGAGALMRAFPHARLLVHPLGTRHLVDPAALAASTRAIYGDAEFERLYGELVPVDAARVVESSDAMTIELAGRTLQLFDSPGHARHHHVVWDAASRGVFSGDSFGISYREFDNTRGAWVLPTTSPTQFDPDDLRATVRRIVALEPQSVYVTHYGRVGDVARLADEFLVQLDWMVAIAERCRTADDRHVALSDALRALYRERVKAHGVAMATEQIDDRLALDVELNAQGLAVWLARRERTGKGALA